jgi:hypothetical protein
MSRTADQQMIESRRILYGLSLDLGRDGSNAGLTAEPPRTQRKRKEYRIDCESRSVRNPCMARRSLRLRGEVLSNLLIGTSSIGKAYYLTICSSAYLFI